MISVVIPVYNEAENIEPLWKDLLPALEKTGEAWEVIFVDDGSKDKTFEILERLKKGNPLNFGFARLSRNFGQSAALACGIECARGDKIITLDGDGQNDPKDIPRLIAKLNEGYGAVCGWRADRQDEASRVLASKIANKMFARLTDTTLHDFGCTLRAYQRSLLAQLHIMGDMHRILPAYLALQGVQIVEIPVSHHPRRRGQSKYGLFSRTIKVLLDAFLLKFYYSYLTRPMHFFGYTASSFFFLGGVIEIFVILRYLLWSGNWLSPLFFLGLFFGTLAVLFLFLGALAELLTRNYLEAYKIKPFHVARTELPG